MFMPKLSGKEIMEMGYINGIQLSMSLFRNHAATETAIIYTQNPNNHHIQKVNSGQRN